MSRSPEADADIRQAVREQRAAAAEPPQPTLLQAGSAVAAVMRYGGQSFATSADRLERLDSQPYPITYVMTQPRVHGYTIHPLLPSRYTDVRLDPEPAQGASAGP